MPSRNDARVVVLRCEDYDRERIGRLVAEGMERLGYRPQGDLFVKPNVVFAGDPDVYGTAAYTHPELVGATLETLAAAPGTRRLALGENSAVGFPTRYCLANAGYLDELARTRKRAQKPVDLVCIDEDRRETAFVGGVVHDVLRISRRMARADGLVYLPKLKCHCVANMTGAVKLNIGICSDDERSIRHDFMLDDKIVDLLAVGYPDLIVMDAIDVGVGNEAFPTPRRVGLLVMSRNPLAADLVGARLLGFGLEDVPYLARAVERGYGPESLDEVELEGDLESLEALDEAALRAGPRDGSFTAWHDVAAELDRLGSPMRFVFGPYSDEGDGELCRTGCVMALKMFLASFERYAGAEAFRAARPVTFVVGRAPEPVDGRGEDVYLIGTCAKAEVENARSVIRIDKCFTTASDLTLQIGGRLGMPSPLANPRMSLPLVGSMLGASARKLGSLRYGEDALHFVSKGLLRRV